jgi:NADPH-dependent curcumin reductase CurA
MNQLGSFKTLCLNKFEGNEFKNELDFVSKGNRIQIAFECIGGKITGLILNSLNENGELFHYGNLSLREITNLSTYDFIFQNKTIKGFWLMKYIEEYGRDKFFEEFEESYIDNYNKDNNLYDPEIQCVFRPEDFNEAIKYYKDNMSKGKVLFDLIR